MAKKKSSNFSSKQIGDILQEVIRKRFGLKPSVNSGAVFADGDELGINFAIEAKGTLNKSISIKLSTWKKIVKEAQSWGRYPLYIAGFIDKDNGNLEEMLCVTTPDYIQDVLHPGRYIQEKIVTQVKEVLTSQNIESSIIHKIEDKLWNLWENNSL